MRKANFLAIFTALALPAFVLDFRRLITPLGAAQWARFSLRARLSGPAALSHKK